MKKSMWKYLKDYKKETVLAPLFKMLEASFELLIPFVVTAIIDVGIARHDTGYIARMGCLMVALGVIGLLCSVTAQFFAARAAVGFSARLRHALFAHVQQFSYTDLDRLGSATMITRMTNDVNQVQNGVNLVLRLFLRSPFIVFGAMCMAFTIDVRAGGLFAVAIVLLSVVVFGIMLISMPLYKKVQAGLDQLLRLTRENLTGIRVLRAFHLEEGETRRFLAQHRELTGRQMFVGRISALMNPLTYGIVNGAVIALLADGALQVDAGRLTQGNVVALLNYMSQILVELVKLANLIITITRAMACADRIENVLRQPSSMPVTKADVMESAPGTAGGQGWKETEKESGVIKTSVIETWTPEEERASGSGAPAGNPARESGTPAGNPAQVSGASAENPAQESGAPAGNPAQAGGTPAGNSASAQEAPPAVEWRGVSLTYEGAGEASLSGISLRAGQGQTIGIIGGTGSGKTSLVHLIPRFYDATQGQVLVNGRDVRDWPLEQLRRNVGIVVQKATLFRGSIRDNLRWGREDADDEALWEALRIAQAADFVKEKPGGLDFQIAQGGKNLSGGQQQRLSIARALVRKPQVLILDDSASALDYATEAALRQALRRIGKETTVFLVSQRAASIRHADQIAVLDDGKLAGLGTHEELLAGCGVYQEIYDSQFEPAEPGREGGASHA